MKAIDFACRLLVRLTEDTLPLPAQQVLLAVAAGLDCTPDIARFTGLEPNACLGHLRALANKGLLLREGGKHPTYRLAPAGKERVRHYFAFMPDRPR